jgi:hypothetical protein
MKIIWKNNKMSTLCKKTWKSYLSVSEQAFSSSKTSRSQCPRSFHYISDNILPPKKLLDIGCGHGNEKYKNSIESIGIKYYGIDPFNQPKINNINFISKTMDGCADIVTLNNVFNVIKEKHIWTDLLIQAKNALNKNGTLIIQVYEGERSKKEKEDGVKQKDLTSVKTRDGWQHRMQTEDYLSFIKDVFPSAKLVRDKKAGKLIIAKGKF